MENSNISQLSSSSSQETSGPKVCWICMSTDEDNNDYENNRDWVSPCKCRYSSRWVHQSCVQRWINEKLMENHSIKAHCPLCRTQYIIVHEVNYLAELLNMLDRTTDRTSPYLTAGVVFAVVYWSAATYGILTIVQVMGIRDAMILWENTNLCISLLVLPTIPLCLIFGKLINWGENIMLFVWRFTSQLPLLRNIMPSFLCESVDEPVNSSRNEGDDVAIIITCSSLCASLLLPTIAVAVGNLLFSNCSYSPLQRTLLGGLVSIAVNGVFRIYQRQKNLITGRTLRVAEYPRTS